MTWRPGDAIRRRPTTTELTTPLLLLLLVLILVLVLLITGVLLPAVLALSNRREIRRRTFPLERSRDFDLGKNLYF